MNKDNIYSRGITAGRPPKFETAEEMSDKINEYFGSLMPELEEGDVPTDASNIFPTVTGLALFLGFASRQSIYDYAKKGDKFSYMVKRALLVIENHYETRLNGRAPTGAIFALKNMNWSDKSEVDMTATIKKAAFQWGGEDENESDGE